MKILITGKKSYIGNSFKTWINKQDKNLIVDQISLRENKLDSISFGSHDVILHVVGIAHISSNKKLIPEYFRVNRDLAIETAKKAKKEGVKQFILTSSMTIFGDDLPIGNYNSIDLTKLKPTNAYGKSKLEADLAIQKMTDTSFKVVILRIPMVYGKNSKGNLPKLEKIASKLLFYPKITNIRSVLNIDNLSRLIHQIVLKNISGVFYPQDKTFFDTNKFIKALRLKKNKRTIILPFTKYLIKLMAFFIKSINKIYGNKFYDQVISDIPGVKYQLEDYYSYINTL
jgi:UDP-glucose 4-epimerase